MVANQPSLYRREAPTVALGAGAAAEVNRGERLLRVVGSHSLRST
jgi:hypothetical protein